MIFDNLLIGTSYKGYIAGTNDGIVTINGVPSARDIIVLDADDFSIVQRNASFANGHYLIQNLDPTKQYLIMARDYEKQYEPVAWDYVSPATDLTVAEQQALWQSWQN